MLAALPRIEDERLIVGTSGFDDAGVVRLSDDLALAHSVDFFPPVVDDPFDFGRIAAANALSDLYAMGATPLAALAVCAFPSGTLPLDVLQRTLAGGLEILRQDHVLPLGGHTVKGPEFTYGLAVTGTVHPDRVLTNAGARPGDLLLLTKALGTGVLSTALKQGKLDRAGEQILIASMATTNRLASEVFTSVPTHALTDVTGYGLLGHALEMASASGIAIELDARAVPALPGAEDAIAARAIPGGLNANRDWVTPRIRAAQVSDAELELMCDPQTSGGLLAALPPAALELAHAEAERRGVTLVVIGRVVDGEAGTATVR